MCSAPSAIRPRARWGADVRARRLPPALARGALGALVLALALAGARPAAAAAASCPKLLMFDGLDLRTQNNAQQAAYWGKDVGVQGFFVNGVMANWQVDVGTNPDSPLWREVTRFQQLYAQDGVTDNFIKVALYKPHNWHDAAANAAVVTRFQHAAMLARHAGMKGIAIDLEPYTPTWGGPGLGPALAPTVEREGRAIGAAMYAAYPGMTLIVLPDVLVETRHYRTLVERFKSSVHSAKQGKPPPKYDAYALAVPFVHGLLAQPWKHLVVATEQTYSRNADGIDMAIEHTHERFKKLAGAQPQWQAFSTAPGLWTLGHTRTDKAARESPARFQRRLATAYGGAKRYVWIYGKGSAWQTDGPYAPGPVVANFDQYKAAIHAVRAQCAAGAATH